MSQTTPNPTAINYPYYHDGVAFHSAAEFQAHLDKGKETIPAAAPARRGSRRLQAAGADVASNIEELAAGLAGADAGEADADQGEGEAE